MNQVKEGTLKHNILETLQECCIIPRRDIGFSFINQRTGQPRTNDRSIRHAVQELIADGYVAVSHKKRDYCYLTKNGWGQLNRIRAMQGVPMGLSEWTTIRKSTFSRQLMIGEAINICHAAGLGAFPMEKPHLATLIEAESSRTYQEYSLASRLRYKNAAGIKMEDVLAKGVFYHSREVKELLQFHELEDFTGYSRFVGIILTAEDVYIVYNTLDRLIRWYETAEFRIIRCIYSLFADCRRYQHQTPDETKGIILAQGDSMVPALVTGHKYGHIRSNSGNGTIKHPLKQIHASVIHGAHYYMVPTNKDGMTHLKNAIHLTKRTMTALYQAQAKKSGGKLLYLPKNEYVPLMRSEDGLPTAFMPWYDIKQLHWIRENISRIHLITYPSFLPHLSKSLGTTLESTSHAGTGEPMDFPRYDNFGEEVNNHF